MLSKLDLSQITVLVVDDNKFIRRLVTEILKNFNAGTIVEAQDGADAIEKLEDARPDLIFSDWMMRPVSGIELLRAVRSGRTPVDRHTPMVMITGQREEPHVVEAREAGATGYLAKPITVDGVMACLQQAIRSTQTVSHG